MKEIEDMDLYEFCRWSALLESIDVIEDQCDKARVKFEDIDLKPLAIQKYVDTAAEGLHKKITNEIKVVTDNKFHVKKDMLKK